MRTPQEIAAAIDGLKLSVAAHALHGELSQVTVKSYLLAALRWTQGDADAPVCEYLADLSEHIRQRKSEVAEMN